VRPLLALLLFALDLYAVALLLDTGLRRSRKLVWTATILFVPFIGAFLWLRSKQRVEKAVIAT
jgi:hypothetical protein